MDNDNIANDVVTACNYCKYIVFGFVLIDLAIVVGTSDLATFANWLFN